MTKHPVALALALAFAVSALPGCDSTANLTEQEHIQRAKDFEDKDDFKSSIIELKNALRRNPESPQARWLLGQIYLKSGLGEDAEKELIKARDLGMKDETLKVDLGQALLLQQDFKRVLEEVQPSSDVPPRIRARFLQLRGDALLGLRQLQEGCDLYHQALDNDSSHVPAYWGLVKCAVARNDLENARVQLDKALKLDPKNSGSWILKGDFERHNKNAQAAVDAYSKAIEIEPRHASALVNRALANLSMNKFELAQKDLAKLRKITPTNFLTVYLQALVLQHQGKMPAAMDAVQQVLKTHPDYMPAVFLAGSIQYNQKIYEQAARNLGRYLEQLPGDVQARKLLAATYLQLNQPEKTLALLKPVENNGEKDAQLLALLGEAYNATGEYSRASEYFRTAVTLQPDDPDLRTKLGRSQLRLGNMDAAIHDFQLASASGKGDAQADILLAITRLRRGEYDDVLKTTTGLIARQPDNVHAMNLKGLAYLGKGDTDNARKVFESAQAAQPGDMVSANYLAQLDLLDKKPESARARFEQILSKDKNNLKAMLALADLARIDKQEQAFITWLDRAAEANPNATKPLLLKSAYYISKGDPRKALASASEAASLSPNSLESLAVLGAAQMANQEYVSAASTFNKLTRLQPRAPQVYLHLAAAYTAAENWTEANSALLKALKLQPDFIDALAALSTLETRRGHIDNARKLAGRIQQSHPKLSIGYKLEGDSLLKQGNYREAAIAYERGYQAEKNGQLAMALFNAYFLTGDQQKAVGPLLDWIKDHPADISAKLFLAEAYQRINQPRVAENQYKLILQQAPNNPDVLNEIALAYQRQGAAAHARKYAEMAYKQRPSDGAIADTLGWILVTQNQVPRGLELIKKAHASLPQHPVVHYHLGAALIKGGNKAEGRRELERLLSRQSKFPQADDARKLLNDRA
jgi:putative PEP-CTERM system TPR-repeat lipoprotein